MGLCKSPDLFQQKINGLFNGLEYDSTYINDLLINSNTPFEDHVNKLEKVLSKPNQKEYKVNAENFFFTRSELEYLGFRISRQEIIPLPDKVEAIKNIAVPTTKKQVRSFI